MITLPDDVTEPVRVTIVSPSEPAPEALPKSKNKTSGGKKRKRKPTKKKLNEEKRLKVKKAAFERRNIR